MKTPLTNAIKFPIRHGQDVGLMVVEAWDCAEIEKDNQALLDLLKEQLLGNRMHVSDEALHAEAMEAVSKRRDEMDK